MKTFKIAQNIVLGVYAESGVFNEIKAEDFELFYAKVPYITDYKKLDVEFIKSDNYYFTKPFLMFEEGDFIMQIKNENADIDYREMIRIIDEDIKNSKILI